MEIEFSPVSPEGSEGDSTPWVSGISFLLRNGGESVEPESKTAWRASWESET